jgi:uncharacterized protein
MLYLDTSLLVSLYATEPESERVERWVIDQDSTEFSLSEWVLTEVSSAFSLKLRREELSAESRDDAISAIERFAARSTRLLPIDNRHFRSANAFCRNFETGLRAGDALHLAIATSYHADICTRDFKFWKAAQALGYAARLI